MAEYINTGKQLTTSWTYGSGDITITQRLINENGEQLTDESISLLSDEDYKKYFDLTVAYMRDTLGWAVVPTIEESIVEDTISCPLSESKVVNVYEYRNISYLLTSEVEKYFSLETIDIVDKIPTFKIGIFSESESSPISIIEYLLEEKKEDVSNRVNSNFVNNDPKWTKIGANEITPSESYIINNVAYDLKNTTNLKAKTLNSNWVESTKTLTFTRPNDIDSVLKITFKAESADEFYTVVLNRMENEITFKFPDNLSQYKKMILYSFDSKTTSKDIPLILYTYSGETEFLVESKEPILKLKSIKDSNNIYQISNINPSIGSIINGAIISFNATKTISTGDPSFVIEFANSKLISLGVPPQMTDTSSQKWHVATNTFDKVAISPINSINSNASLNDILLNFTDVNDNSINNKIQFIINTSATGNHIVIERVGSNAFGTEQCIDYGLISDSPEITLKCISNDDPLYIELSYGSAEILNITKNSGDGQMQIGQDKNLVFYPQKPILQYPKTETFTITFRNGQSTSDTIRLNIEIHQNINS